MSKRRISPLVTCPYYKGDDGQRTVCTGPLPKMTNSQTFDTPGERVKFRKRYCYRVQGHRDCPIYQMIAKMNE